MAQCPEPERLAAYVANTPLRRVGDPVDDVGEGVVFLCSAQSRYVTGTTIVVDGGMDTISWIPRPT